VTSTGDFAGLARAIEFPGSKAVGRCRRCCAYIACTRRSRCTARERSRPTPTASYGHRLSRTFTMGTIAEEDKMATKMKSSILAHGSVIGFPDRGYRNHPATIWTHLPDYGKAADVPVSTSPGTSSSVCQYPQIGGALQPRHSGNTRPVRQPIPWSFGEILHWWNTMRV